MASTSLVSAVLEVHKAVAGDLGALEAALGLASESQRGRAHAGGESPAPPACSKQGAGERVAFSRGLRASALPPGPCVLWEGGDKSRCRCGLRNSPTVEFALLAAAKGSRASDAARSAIAAVLRSVSARGEMLACGARGPGGGRAFASRVGASAMPRSQWLFPAPCSGLGR